MNRGFGFKGIQQSSLEDYITYNRSLTTGLNEDDLEEKVEIVEGENYTFSISLMNYAKEPNNKKEIIKRMGKLAQML